MKVNALNIQKKIRRLTYALTYVFPQCLCPTEKYYNFPLKLGRRHKCGIKYWKEEDNVIIICKRYGIVEKHEKISWELLIPNERTQYEVW